MVFKPDFTNGSIGRIAAICSIGISVALAR
jgi:hypothetical protein